MIGGFEPPNSGSHFEMSSSSPMTPRSTKVMNVAAVSHFVDDAIADRRGARHASDGVLVDHRTVGGDDPDHAARQPGGTHPLLEQRVGGVERVRSEDLANRGRGRDRDRRRGRNGGRRRHRIGRIARCARRRRPTADEQQSRRDERDCRPQPHEDARLSCRADQTNSLALGDLRRYLLGTHPGRRRPRPRSKPDRRAAAFACAESPTLVLSLTRNTPLTDRTLGLPEGPRLCEAEWSGRRTTGR